MKLFYRQFGSGPPLVILHGLYGSSDNWVTIANNLAESFTVYLPDQRNHGRSPHSPVHDYKSMRDDLYDFVKELKIERFFLAGHSMGGKTAIAFAAEWPEMIYGLLVADVSPFPDENTSKVSCDQHREILETILSVDLSGIMRREDVELILRERISSERVRSFILKNLQRTDNKHFSWKMNPHALYSNLDRILGGIEIHYGSENRITGFPVIFLKGENSLYITAGDISRIKSLFPSAEIIGVDNAGHWIHADRPDEVIKNIRRLLESY